MKRIFIVITFLMIAKYSFGQEQANAGKSNSKYAGDIILDQEQTYNQRNVRLSVAFNGWMYAAYSIIDSATNSSGIKIVYSKDNGLSWNTMNAYIFNNITYPAFDIVVAGNDTNSLMLYVAGVRKNSDTDYVLYIDKYNATNAQYLENPYRSNKNNSVLDIALASDYRQPSINSAPYSVAMLYSYRNLPYDSLNYVLSTDGGANFNYENNVTIANNYLRKISLSYGRSPNFLNGRYYAAWEVINSNSPSANGNIYTSHNQNFINDAWQAPHNIDSIAPAAAGLCRYPQIATQFNDIDNDSIGISTLIVAERDYQGVGSDHDILGFYNVGNIHANNWSRALIDNSSATNTLTPHVRFDPAYNNFLLVYYDSTNQKLPYLVNSMNLSQPDTWTKITEQYNDDTTNLIAPWPKVEINPALNQVAHVWIAEGQNNKGIAMLDAEYLHTGINEEPKSIFSNGVIYPNPASETATISFNMKTSSDATIQIIDITGKIILDKEVTNINAGKGVEKIDVRDWDNGVYFFSILSNKEKFTSRFVVSH